MKYISQKKTFIFIIFIYTLFSSYLPASVDNKGTDFWVTFPYSGDGTSDQHLILTGNTNTTGTVTIPGLSFSQNFSVMAGAAIKITLPAGTEITGTDSIENKGIHIISVDEIVVLATSYRWSQNNTDAYLGLPVDSLGIEYLILSYSNGGVQSGTQFAIVAVEDGTAVTITPSASVGARTVGVPYNILLNEGQCYQLRDDVSTTTDLTGTIISSDKNIAVFGSHSCAHIPLPEFGCNYIVEQLPPVKYWGTEFLSAPLATRLNGDAFRLLASQDNTNININGALVVTLNRGEYYEQVITTSTHIVSDEPILVAQYSHCSTYDGITGDPSMMNITPINQYTSNYITSNLDMTWFDPNFVNIMASASSVGSIMLDSVPIPAGDFTPIGASGYYSAQVSVTAGEHIFSGPEAFGAFVYGFDNADAYSYPAGLIVPTPTITPTYTASPVNTSTETPTITLTPIDSPTVTPTITPTEGPFYLKLINNFPNPFNDKTYIVYELGKHSEVIVKVFTVSGEKVVEISETGQPGKNSILWDGRNHAAKSVASGIYIYSVEARVNEERAVKWGKCVVVK